MRTIPRRIARWGAVALVASLAAGCDDRPPPNLGGEPFPTKSDPAGEQPRSGAVPGAERYGALIAINPARVEEYVKLNEEAPKAVGDALHRHGIRNFSVFLTSTREQIYAIRYYEYVGEGHDADLAELEHVESYRTWRNACEECQVTLMPLATGEWWAPSEEILHFD